MHKIINTTDGKYVGREIDINTQEIRLDSDFIFKIEKITYNKDSIQLSNNNYVVDVVLINSFEKEKSKITKRRK